MATQAPARHEVTKQPAGFIPICLTEFWERLAFYGMQSILVLYLTDYLFKQRDPAEIWLVGPLQQLFGMSGQALASSITGGYLMFVAVVPLIGGYLTDRFIGLRRAILLGGAMMAVGHLLMVAEQALLLALLFIGAGSGLFRGAIAGQLGSLYDSESRRVEAYQLLFLAVNLAGVTGPVLIGSLADKAGWHWGFASAAIAMSLAMLIYFPFARRLTATAAGTEQPLPQRPRLADQNWPFILPLIAGMGLVAIPNLQLFNAYLIWAKRDFDLEVFGFEFPPSWLIGMDAALGIVILSASVAAWRAIERRLGPVPALTRMALGSLAVCAGAGVLVIAAAVHNTGQISLAWPIAFQLLNSIGLAQILPGVMALVGGKANGATSATAMGAYFVTLFVASLGSTLLATRFETMSVVNFWLLHLGCTMLGGTILFALHRRGGRPGPDAAIGP